MSGWFKTYYSLLDWEWYHDIPVCRLFTHLLLIANYEQKRWQGRVIGRGELITSLEHLAKGCDLSIRQTRTALSKLQSTGEIVIKTTNKFTLITICNYATYQDSTDVERQTNDKQTTNKRQTNDNNLRIEEIKNNIECVYTREENFENSDFESRLSDDQNWCETLAMNYHLTVDAVRTLVAEAAATFRLDNEPPRDYSSFRQRCRQYINAHYKRYLQQKTQQNGTDKNNTRNFASHSAEDYYADWVHR